MKTTVRSSMRWIITLTLLLASTYTLMAQDATEEQTGNVKQVAGYIIDKNSGDPIANAAINWSNSNIAVISNKEGKFTIKSNKFDASSALEITSLGYQKRVIPITELKEAENRIELVTSPISLTQINVFPTDPTKLIRSVLNSLRENYQSEQVMATTFYRETIKKGWNYASLSEAVLLVNRFPYGSSRADEVKIVQGRKSTDYSRIDTLTFNMEGGPFSALRMDILKEPYLLFDNEEINKYDFTMAQMLPNDEEMNYVIEFKQKASINEPLFYGKLFIDPKKNVITKAVFNMNLENKAEATAIFIKRKPASATVTPILASYTVTYAENNGKWYYAYSRGDVNFKVNWKKKLFNSTFYTTIEMAVTNWKPTEEKHISSAERLRPSVKMNQAVQGFKDENFWGNYNIIEPEIPIEKAIEKIRKNIK